MPNETSEKLEFRNPKYGFHKESGDESGKVGKDQILMRNLGLSL
jgi:hypothetical protein